MATTNRPIVSDRGVALCGLAALLITVTILTGIVALRAQPGATHAPASCPAYPGSFWFASYDTTATGVQSPVPFAGYCVSASSEPPTTNLVVAAPNSDIIAVAYDIKGPATYEAERVILFHAHAQVPLASYQLAGGTTVTLRTVYRFTPLKGLTTHPELLKYYFGGAELVVADGDGYGVCSYATILESLENPNPNC